MGAQIIFPFIINNIVKLFSELFEHYKSYSRINIELCFFLNVITTFIRCHKSVLLYDYAHTGKYFHKNY